MTYGVVSVYLLLLTLQCCLEGQRQQAQDDDIMKAPSGLLGVLNLLCYPLKAATCQHHLLHRETDTTWKQEMTIALIHLMMGNVTVSYFMSSLSISFSEQSLELMSFFLKKRPTCKLVSTSRSPAPPPKKKIQTHTKIKLKMHQGGLTFDLKFLPGRLPVCAELSTSRRTGVLSWTTLGWMDIAAKADKHCWRTAWRECSSEAVLLLSPCSMGSEKVRRRGGQQVGHWCHCKDYLYWTNSLLLMLHRPNTEE